MSIYKRGHIYWYKFTFNGIAIRESTRQSNQHTARQMEAAHRTSLAKGEVGIREKKTVLTLAAFLEHRIEPWASRRPSWIWYRSGIRALVRYQPLCSLRLDEIRSEQAGDYAAHRLSEGLQPGSINSSLRVLRRVLRLAVEWGALESAPKIELLKGERRRERVVATEEEFRYLSAASPLLKAVATVLADTGLRPDECHRLQWEEISWGNGRNGTLLVTHGKTVAARRVLPMAPRVRSILESRWMASGRPAQGWIWPAPTKTGHIDHSSLKKQHDRAIKISGVRPFVLYSLRHTFLTRLGESGCDPWTLARIAGHSSIAISSRYVHPSEEALLVAMSRLGGHNSGHSMNRAPAEELSIPCGTPAELGVYMVSAAGLEPATHALKGHCSTN
jgi:integrase